VVEALAELSMLLPHMTLPISRMWIGDRPDTSYDSEWARRRDQVTRLGLRIERDARRPMRRARMIERSAFDTLARVTAMTNLWHGSESQVTAVESGSDHPDVGRGNLLGRTDRLDLASDPITGRSSRKRRTASIIDSRAAWAAWSTAWVSIADLKPAPIGGSARPPAAPVGSVAHEP
jgi:hypothetical protein